jgi:GNAT superfamily N-acetyltransferase
VSETFELASYEPADREAYLGLLDEAWGERAISGAEFDWWFGGNPAGSVISVARMDGRIVGAAAHSLVRMMVDGEERTVSFSLHAVTHSSARGRGVFAELERRNEREAAERGATFALTFPNNLTASVFLGRLGWTEIGRLRVWARPLLAQASGPLDTSRFDGLHDAAAGWPNHVVRDARHLNWRFLDSPRRYRTVRSADGYAVVGQTRYRRIETAVLADFVGGSRELLRRAVSVATGRLMIALPAPEQRATFLSLGFVPAPYTLRLLGKAPAGKLNADPAAWRLTLGDTDFF